jgi:hypothetical protein
MPTTRRYWVAAAFFWASVCGVYAQTRSVEREITASPDRDARVGIYTNIRPDCTTGPLPMIRLVTPPTHGAVTVKRGTLKATNLKQCLATEVPAFVAFYRAAREFSGTDDFVLEISLAEGRKVLEHFRVNVSPNAAGGQGI